MEPPLEAQNLNSYEKRIQELEHVLRDSLKIIEKYATGFLELPTIIRIKKLLSQKGFQSFAEFAEQYPKSEVYLNERCPHCRNTISVIVNVNSRRRYTSKQCATCGYGIQLNEPTVVKVTANVHHRYHCPSCNQLSFVETEVIATKDTPGHTCLSCLNCGYKEID